MTLFIEALVRPMVFALLVLSSAASGGQPNVRQDLDKPGPEHEKLNALSGSWDVTVMHPVGPGRSAEGKASYNAEWVMDGRFLRQTYTSTFAGKPLEIVRYLGFDRRRGKVVEIQLESTHTDVMHNQGSISFDGATTLTCFGTQIDLATGKESRVQTVTTIVDPQTFTFELKYLGGDGAEEKTVRLIHRRKL